MPRIENLLFEGGGNKGYAFTGALEILEDFDIFRTVKKVAGSSAGAITAALLALGYKSKEIKDILDATPFSEFADDSFGVFRDTVRLLGEYGLCKGTFFREWFSQLVEKKTGSAQCTFKQLKEMDGTLDLYITGTNLNWKRTEIFSHEHTPDMEIVQAVRISMSLPYFFRAVKHNGDLYVDGGCAYNYPIDLFDHEDGSINWSSLGFRVDDAHEITSMKDSIHAKSRKEIDSIISYTETFIGMYLDIANKRHLKEDDRKRTVFIDTTCMGVAEFDCTPEERNTIYLAGKKATLKYLIALGAKTE